MFIDVRARIETRWSDVADFVGLRAALYDVDPLDDDLLAEGLVGVGGVVAFRFDARRARSLDSPAETAPDMRLVVVHADGRVVFRSRVIGNARLPPPAGQRGEALPCEFTFVESSLE